MTGFGGALSQGFCWVKTHYKKMIKASYVLGFSLFFVILSAFSFLIVSRDQIYNDLKDQKDDGPSITDVRLDGTEIIYASNTVKKISELQEFLQDIPVIGCMTNAPDSFMLLVLAASTAGLGSAANLMKKSLCEGNLPSARTLVLFPSYSLVVGMMGLFFLMALPAVFQATPVQLKPSGIIVLCAGCGLVPDVVFGWLQGIVLAFIARSKEDRS